MPVEPARTRYRQLVDTVGRAAVHALFPTDIEVYLMALELTTGAGDTIDYFAFPILPNQITKTEPTRTTIRKTSGGVTVFTSDAFVPQSVQIKGNFGRHFRILLSPKATEANGIAWSTQSGVYSLSEARNLGRLSFTTPLFSFGVKTGYGATRILKAIVNKSNGVDFEGKPFRLYFYNLALGESYLVTIPPSGITVQQTLDKNMIWEYTLNMTVLAPLNALENRAGPSSLVRTLGIGAIQQGVNTVANSLTGIIG